LDRLKHFKIIVSTSSTAATLCGVGMAKHFSHIIIDEASQMLETESLIPISLASKTTHIVLAGDDKQIGPVIHSPSAKHHKLDLSIMSRLGGLSVYNTENVKIRLVNNYRSHQDILRLLSELFYENERLVAKGNKIKLESLVNSKVLPKKGFPIAFFGVQGVNQQTETNPSWFNEQEVEKVHDIVVKLLAEKIDGSDIGIISPFSLQVMALRNRVKKSRVIDEEHKEIIKVGTPEEFQGTERKVIIVSTVRSSEDQHVTDMRHRLGILKNAKKMNSALSRAACMLIVVGNQYVLQNDPEWGKFLKFVEQNGGSVFAKSQTLEQIQEQNRKQNEERALNEEKLKREEEEKKKIRGKREGKTK